MDARSGLLAVYREHLRQRGGQAPVAALVRLLAPLGIAAPAVRTAVSRTVRQGWLVAAAVQGSPGYRLTPRGLRQLQDDAARAERTAPASWDGRWHLLAVSPPPSRAARERLSAALRLLGYGPLGESGRTATWVSAHESAQVDALLASEGARAERFSARHDGDSQALVGRVWDVEALARAYRRFLDEGADGSADPAADTDADRFARRLLLGEAWRGVQALDPGLPLALLPPDWPGGKAAAWFAAERARLWPAAERFVQACLQREQPAPGQLQAGPGEPATAEPPPLAGGD